MSKKILVVYKSVTGFTKQYAEAIAQAVGGDAIPLKKANAKALADCDAVVYGGRLYGGFVSGLKQFRPLAAECGADRFLVFAVGAMPCSAEDTLAEMWKQNLTAEELKSVPHFYMQGGLRYDKMPLHEKLMMKAYSKMLREKKGLTEYEREAGNAMAESYDCFSEEQAQPMIAVLKTK